MKIWFKKHFALTDRGAKDLAKASISSFFVYIINLFPAMFLMFFLNELILDHVNSEPLYILISAGGLTLMYLLLRIEYDALYNATYRESANLRTEIADILTKR